MRIFVWHSSDVWEEVVMFDVFQVHRQKKRLAHDHKFLLLWPRTLDTEIEYR